MARKIVISLCLLLLYIGATAQQSDDYRYYKLYEDEHTDIPLIDDQQSQTVVEFNPNLLWYRSIFNTSSAVINNRHGIGYYDRRTAIGGLFIPKIGQNRLARLSISKSANLATEDEHYTFTPITRNQTSVGINLTSRNYLGGVSATTAHTISEKWTLATDSYIHSGRDLHIDGVFTSEAAIAVAAQGRLDSLSTLSVALFFAPSERAGRKAAVAETFALTANNYYNPSWGYQAGKVRSADITRKLLPTAIACYAVKLSEKNSLSVSLGATIGEQSESGLDWLNASTPLPDNYRKLPSYFYDEATSAAVATAWASNDSRYTQIAFDELYRRNRLHNQAVYLVSDRVSRVVDLQLCAAMTRELTHQSRISYGLRAQYLRTGNFKRVADLLGGAEFSDIDYFLVDDDTFSNMLKNDLQHPDRKVGVRDKYGYHYALTNLQTHLFATYNGDFERVQLQATAQIGTQQIYRKGLFRKELFADTSLGRSKTLNFIPWLFSAEARWSIAPSHTLYGHLRAEAVAADGEDMFLQTQYNNRTVESPTLANLYTASVGYKFHNHKLVVDGSLFLRYSSNQTTVSHLYYDAAAEFADVVTSGINTLCFGFEAEAHYNFAKSWTAAAGLCAGRYTYASAPNLKVYADSDNRLLADQDIDTAKGLHLGQTPQISTYGQISFHSHGWRATAEAQYHALRYVAPSLIRRSEDVLSHAESEQIRAEFITQQQLDDAFALNITLSKSIYLRRFDRKIYSTTVAPRFIDRHPYSRITIFAAVNNLLSNSNIYRGYESSRIRKRYLWQDFTATPQPSYLLYSYPRTYYIGIKFVF